MRPLHRRQALQLWATLVAATPLLQDHSDTSVCPTRNARETDSLNLKESAAGSNTTFWVQRRLRYEVHYAALGLLCALLVTGLPTYLVLSGNRAQAEAPPVVKAVAQPAPERARPITADLRLPTGNNVLSH